MTPEVRGYLDEIKELKNLITELADALEPYAGPDSTGLVDIHAGLLVQRAREATQG